jgi:hypothetical protein
MLRTVLAGLAIWALIVQSTLALYSASAIVASADGPNATIICLSSGKKSSSPPAAQKCQQCLTCTMRVDLAPPATQALRLPRQAATAIVDWYHGSRPPIDCRHGLPAARAPPELAAPA